VATVAANGGTIVDQREAGRAPPALYGANEDRDRQRDDEQRHTEEPPAKKIMSLARRDKGGNETNQR
jgi:hypothetical protein